MIDLIHLPLYLLISNLRFRCHRCISWAISLTTSNKETHRFHSQIMAQIYAQGDETQIPNLNLVLFSSCKLSITVSFSGFFFLKEVRDKLPQLSHTKQ